MRKTSVLISAILLVFFLHIPVSAASTTYILDELGLEVTIPSGYYVITRDTPGSDPVFSIFDVTKESLVSQFETSGIYLNAVPLHAGEEIVVTMTTSPLDNFSTFSDASLETIASLLPSQFADYGISISEYEIYHHPQAKFIKVYFTDSALTVHGLQYYTVYDGMAINFTMRSYAGSLSALQEYTIQKVVDSIVFDSAPPPTVSGKDTDPFVYTDRDSDVTFTVPGNWEQEALSKDREFIDAKFVSTKDAGRTIIYGSTDLWMQLSASERAGYSRADLNNSFFTKHELAELYGVAAHEISVVTYNDVRYYSFETTAENDLGLSATMTMLIHIDNGWLYMFQFFGTDRTALFSDFESLLESVEYPAASVPATIPATVPAPSVSRPAEEKAPESSGALAAGIVLLILVAGFAAMILIRKKTKKEAIHYASDQSTGQSPSGAAPNISGKAAFCRKCGQPLPPDSVFCHICGTKIIPEAESQ